MNKIFTSILLMSTFLAFSQNFTVKKADGTAVSNNETIGFSTITYPSSQLALKITNTSSSTISLKLVCESITNTNGAKMEVCFGLDCTQGSVVNQIYPQAVNVDIASNEINSTAKFFSTELGINTSNPVQYKYKFYQVNANGEEIGTPFRFTYKYSSTLSNEIHNTNLVSVLKSNYIDDALNFDTNKDLDIAIYDITGKKLYNTSLKAGTQNVDVSFLKASLYILLINDGLSSVNTKFIKK